MSLLDMAGQFLGGQNNNQNAISAVLSAVNNHPGGLSGLIDAFEQKGLGGVVNSWVQPGTPNEPVTGEQVQNVLGSGQVASIAEKMGVSPSVAGSVLAQFLPQVVDHLTPNGQVPSSGTNVMQLGQDLLKRFI